MAAPCCQISHVYKRGKLRWYKLQSKPGIKEKERGEIQVSIKFTRNNMTASMFNLSVKEKSRTPFGKLKDKIKGKKYDMESASAIVPSSVGRLDSDDEDFRREGSDKKSKAKGFFLKNKLRKSSLTGSNSSLRSNNSISSASGANNPDITIAVPELTKKPAHRNLSSDGYVFVEDNQASPRQTHKRAFSDEVGQFTGAVAESKAIHNLKPKGSPISKSSLCVNGSHVYKEEPAPKANIHVAEPSIVSRSMQNIAKKQEEIASSISAISRSPQPKIAGNGSEKLESNVTPPATGMHEESKVSTKVTLNHPNNKVKMEAARPDSKPVQIATPILISTESTKEKPEEAKREDKKPKVSLFHHGSGKSDAGSKTFAEKTGPAQMNSPHVVANPEERSKTSGWFGSKDAAQKPSFSSGSNATGEAEDGAAPPGDNEPSSIKTRPRALEDLENSQAARDSADGFTKSMPCMPDLVTTPQWDDPFDALATSRLMPERKDEKASTPLFPTELATTFFGSLNAISPVTALHTSRVSIKPDSGAIPSNSVAMATPELQAGKTYSAIEESLLSVADMKETEPKLDAPELKLMAKNGSALLESSSAPAENSVIPTILSARIRTSAEPKNPPLLPQHADEGYGEAACEEKQTAQHEKVSSMPWNGSHKGIFIGHSEDDPASQMRENGNMQKDKPVSVKVNTLSNLCKSEEAFSIMPVKSENKIAAVPPLVFKLAPDTTYQGVLEEEKAAPKYSSKGINHVFKKPGDLPKIPSKNKNMSNAQNTDLPADERLQIVFSKPPVNGTGVWPPESKSPAQQGDDHSIEGGGLEMTKRLVLPPKPPRCFTSAEEEQEKTDLNKARGREGKGSLVGKQVAGSKGEMWDPNTRIVSETVSHEPPCPPFPDAVIGVHAEWRASIDGNSELATEDLCSNSSKKVNEATVQDTSNGGSLLDTNLTEVEQFKTCPLKFSLDGLDLSSIEDKFSKLDAVKLGLVLDSSSEGQLDQINECRRDAQGIVNFDMLSTEPLANGGKRPVSELPTASATTRSVLFWSALEDQLQVNEPLSLCNASQIKPSIEPVNLQVGLESGVAPQETWTELSQQDLYNEMQQTGQIQPRVPRLQHVLSLGSSIDSNQQDQIQTSKCGTTLGLSASQQSSWSADMVVDFKNVDFWEPEADLVVENGASCTTKLSANPFVLHDRRSLQHKKNPFVETSSAISNPSEKALQEDLSFRYLHQEAAPPNLPPIKLDQDPMSPFLHDSQPLAFSTPFLAAATNLKSLALPSSIISLATCVGPTATTEAAALSSCCTSPSSGVKPSSLMVLPQETQPADHLHMQQKSSPHPVKPISATVTNETAERKPQKSSLTTAFSSGLEKLRTATTSSVQPVAPSVTRKTDQEGLKDPGFTDLAAKYYHLTHDELIHMLLQRERELSQKDEHLHELETYIDQLLVRIMDQAPTLLQIPLEKIRK
ncbi:rab11 family-interacting protein 5 isoform X2 [Ambystoma mexicanum]|uniref:rab11 family-interacting protein 5 isoform X2 n=1 Tax=Ambystoma mexicanum TaxID=8296 RepID=UPI0037E7748D